MIMPIYVLMVDDEEDNFNSLKNFAADNNILLEYRDNLKDAIQYLNGSNKIDALILDGKGFIRPDQQHGTEKEDFVHEALTRITLLENQKNIFYPKCVYTGWYEKLFDSLSSRIQVFDKNKLSRNDAEKKIMFDYLKDEVKNQPNFKIRKRYSVAFEDAEILSLSAEEVQRLFEAVKKINSQKIEAKDFNSLRIIFETILIKINQISSVTLPYPNMFYENGNPILGNCIRFLSGQQVNIETKIIYPKCDPPPAPPHIGYLCYYIKNGTSALSHQYSYFWGSNVYESLVLGLLEIYSWLANLKRNL